MQTALLIFFSIAAGGLFGWAFGAVSVEWQACVRGYARKHPITGRFQWMDDVERPSSTETGSD